MIDLRSDTVTHPTETMRHAMYQAEVGDDVYGEDPTINRLEEMAATLLGKEDALFVPSGSMGNTVALLTHAGRGQAVIVSETSHIYCYESGSASTLGGIPVRIMTTDAHGMPDITQLQTAIKDKKDTHDAPTALICLENTQNHLGGTVISAAQIGQVSDLAHTRGVSVHLDGARIFNASTALNTPVHTLVQSVDSIMFCLSKGLAAPVGSLLVGKKDFILRARYMRKLLGGNMRQAGIIAAAGIVALETMVERLADDHANCQRLALGLAELPQIEIDPEQVVTNILVFRIKHTQPETTRLFLQAVRNQGVLMGELGLDRIRAVTHYEIETHHIDKALHAIQLALTTVL